MEKHDGLPQILNPLLDATGDAPLARFIECTKYEHTAPWQISIVQIQETDTPFNGDRIAPRSTSLRYKSQTRA